MNKMILVVDDDRSVRDSLKKVLEEAGHSVVQAADGEEGAKRMNEEDFDLVILDLDLPKLCGFDLLDMASANHPSRPVVVLTGMLDHCEPGSLAGADLVLEKPPDVALLLSGISALLAASPNSRLRRARNTGKPQEISAEQIEPTQQVAANPVPPSEIKTF